MVTRGALEKPTIRVIGTAHRSTNTVTTTVKAALPRGAAAIPRGYRNPLRPLLSRASRRRRLTAVTDDTVQPGEPTPETVLHTESHDPAVPEAYSQFMPPA